MMPLLRRLCPDNQKNSWRILAVLHGKQFKEGLKECSRWVNQHWVLVLFLTILRTLCCIKMVFQFTVKDKHRQLDKHFIEITIFYCLKTLSPPWHQIHIRYVQCTISHYQITRLCISSCWWFGAEMSSTGTCVCTVGPQMVALLGSYLET